MLSLLSNVQPAELLRVTADLEDKTIPAPEKQYIVGSEEPVRVSCPKCCSELPIGSKNIVRFNNRIWHVSCFRVKIGGRKRKGKQ